MSDLETSDLETSDLEISDLDHVLELARLSLDDNEKSRYLKTLQTTLGTMQLMDALPLEGVSPSTHATHGTSYFRNDSVIDYESLMLEKNAPDWDESFNGFTVPKIV